MDIRINSKVLSGKIDAISSKSDAHRNIIAAALATNGSTILKINSLSEDIRATIDCVRALGGRVNLDNEKLIVNPIRLKEGCSPLLNCSESGSTARFLLPLAATLYEQSQFTGCGRLPLRPLTSLSQTMIEKGCVFSQKQMPFTMTGRIVPGKYILDGHQSSQYITGLLFALPILPGDSEIYLRTPLESVGYVQMTMNTLKRFGIQITTLENGFLIKGQQKYISPGMVQIEGDWSNAAFWLASGALGSRLAVTGLKKCTLQRDRNIVGILEKFGARIIENSAVTVAQGSLRPIEIDAKDIPDLVPVLAVVAATIKGTTFIRNIARLRLKESDRILSIINSLTTLGANVCEKGNTLEITGGGLKGGIVDSFNDHRIVMALAIAAEKCAQGIIIKNAQAVNKSYPHFFEDFKKLGGEADVL